MDLMSAAALSNISTTADIPHGLSLTVMKKGMDAHEELALKQIHDMLPQQMAPLGPGKGDFIDVYA